MRQGHSLSNIKNSETVVPVYGLINWLALLELPLATEKERLITNSQYIARRAKEELAVERTGTQDEQLGVGISAGRYANASVRVTRMAELKRRMANLWKVNAGVRAAARRALVESTEYLTMVSDTRSPHA